MAVLTAMDLSGLLTAIGSIFTALIGYVGDICSTITDQPLLLLGVAIPFAFAIVSFLHRIIYVRMIR